MICKNCGNELGPNTIICDECGRVAERSSYNKKTINIQGIVALVLGILSIMLCFRFMTKDISIVWTYMDLTKRAYFAINIVIEALVLSMITLIVSYNGKHSDSALNKTGLFLSIVSIFFIIFEIVVVMVY